MAHFHPRIRTRRVERFVDLLSKSILTASVRFDARCARTDDPVPFDQRLALSYTAVSEGAAWGSTWNSAWFHLAAQVPAEWAGSYVVARIDLGGETLVFKPDGSPWVGLTSGSVFDGHYSKDILHLLPRCKGGEKVDLWAEAAANGLFGVQRTGDPAFQEDPSRLHGYHEGRAKALRLCRFDYEAWQLWLDAQVLTDLVKCLPDTTARHARLLRGLNAAADAYAKEGTAAARAALKPLLAVPSDPSTIDVHGVGHAHIDTGWLWPVRETIRKCGRTFASQIDLIERYPGYVFGASQAQLYQFTKTHYPALYERIRKAVAAGRWEVQGGMWVEADCNVPAGESLVRQLVHGMHFFRDEFGVTVRNLWLPDVFGYSGNLPQILKKAGIDYFLTQKLSWNKYNTFPHHTFNWRGIDGSEILAHFPPEDDYNSCVMPANVRKNETNYKDRGVVGEAVALFGIGNGGGGPKEEHIERALRMRDLNGTPRYHLGAAQPVLERLGRSRAELDTWAGELYFELHRGTLTTQAATKRLNRRAEEALRATEMLCAAAGLKHYPAAELDAAWKTLLINQFHDILPGSSIHMVYEQTERELAGVLDTCRRLAGEAAPHFLEAEPDCATVFNPSTTPFDDVVALPGTWTGGVAAQKSAAVQRDGDRTYVRLQVPPQGFTTVRAGRAPAETPWQPARNLALENELVRYEFDRNLRLVAGRDKVTGRDLVPAGQAGNVLSLYDDRPHDYDAWDIDEYYMSALLQTASAGKLQRADGPARSGLRGTLSVGTSTIVQTVWLRPGSRRLDFETQVDWHESHRMLRVSFPTTIQTDAAAFEIQYGWLKRPTHRNSPWDQARFEAAGHRWADLSEPDYGVALLNDSKYGYAVRDHVLDLNLLRSSTDPDPVADRGMHHFRYALLPHEGDLPRSNVIAEAAMLNQGVTVIEGYSAADAALPVAVEGAGVELVAVKRAEKSAHFVVRLVEGRGMHTSARLVCRDPKARIVPTDLVELTDGPSLGKGTVALDFTPFEIKTFKIVRSKPS